MTLRRKKRTSSRNRIIFFREFKAKQASTFS